MKILKALSLTAVIFMFLTSFTALVGDSPHVGRWKGEDKGDMGFLELTSDGYATFEFEGQKMGGKSYVSDGVELAMTYKIDKKQKHELKNGILYLKGGDLTEELMNFPKATQFNLTEYFEDEFFETKKVVHNPLKYKIKKS